MFHVGKSKYNVFFVRTASTVRKLTMNLKNKNGMDNNNNKKKPNPKVGNKIDGQILDNKGNMYSSPPGKTKYSSINFTRSLSHVSR